MSSDQLRDVCIQDPRRQTAYLIPSAALATYEIRKQPSVLADRPYVTFAHGEDALIDTTSVREPVTAVQPDVLIRDLDLGSEYYIPFGELKQHEIERPSDHPVAKTFTIPMPEALVEELPAAIRALLQTDYYSRGPDGRRILRDSK